MLPKHHFVADCQKIFPHIWPTPTERNLSNVCIYYWTSLWLIAWFSLLMQQSLVQLWDKGDKGRPNIKFWKPVNHTSQKHLAPTQLLHHITSSKPALALPIIGAFWKASYPSNSELWIAHHLPRQLVELESFIQLVLRVWGHDSTSDPFWVKFDLAFHFTGSVTSLSNLHFAGAH